MPKKVKEETSMVYFKKMKIVVGPDAQAVLEDVDPYYNPTDQNPERLPVEGSTADNPLMLGECDREECGPDSESEDEVDDGEEVPVAGSSRDNPLEVEHGAPCEVVEIDD